MSNDVANICIFDVFNQCILSLATQLRQVANIQVQSD